MILCDSLNPYTAHSIDLYVINLKIMDMPNLISHITAGECLVRQTQTMLEEMALSAFGCCSWAGVTKMATVPRFTVEQNFDLRLDLRCKVLP